jgi:hypothetical protein
MHLMLKKRIGNDLENKKGSTGIRESWLTLAGPFRNLSSISSSQRWGRNVLNKAVITCSKSIVVTSKNS